MKKRITTLLLALTLITTLTSCNKQNKETQESQEIEPPQIKATTLEKPVY